MALIGIKGDSRKVNTRLLLQSLGKGGALLLDCANCANPHALLPFVVPEQFNRVFVLPIDLMYKLRDTLRFVPRMAKEREVRDVFVTTFCGLFDYGDERENHEVFSHAWELMRKISEDYDIYVGIEAASMHESFANRYCSSVIAV